MISLHQKNSNQVSLHSIPTIMFLQTFLNLDLHFIPMTFHQSFNHHHHLHLLLPQPPFHPNNDVPPNFKPRLPSEFQLPPQSLPPPPPPSPFADRQIYNKVIIQLKYIFISCCLILCKKFYLKIKLLLYDIFQYAFY